MTLDIPKYLTLEGVSETHAALRNGKRDLIAQNVTESPVKRNGEDYRRYRALAEQDLQRHKMLWRRDCLPGGLEESCEYLNTAVESAGKALHCPENTLLYFPSEK